MNEKAVLIGNGINRAISNNVKSWEDLLRDIASSFEVSVDLKNEFKPFPLTFEEILFKNQGKFDLTLTQIKNKIAKVFANTPSNELHKKVVNSGIKNILTTNYDYAFEKAIIQKFQNEEDFTVKSTDETLNSIYRRIRFKEKISKEYNIDKNLNIWHIHGELQQRLSPDKLKKTSRANSIMIGYEHYGAYLVEIQNYIKGNKKKQDKNIFEKIEDENYKPISWIDFFFMRDLHIFGISYDFSEQHLWWLLNYRAKQIKRNKINKKKINNIYYYYIVLTDKCPDDISEYAKQLAKKKMNKAKIDLFESLRVKIVPIEIENNDYKDYFNKVMEMIKNNNASL